MQIEAVSTSQSDKKGVFNSFRGCGKKEKEDVGDYLSRKRKRGGNPFDHINKREKGGQGYSDSLVERVIEGGGIRG